MALHEQCVGATDEWYTPPHVFEALANGLPGKSPAQGTTLFSLGEDGTRALRRAAKNHLGALMEPRP